MEIETKTALKAIMKESILRPLMNKISEEIKQLLIDIMVRDSAISVSSLSEMATYSIQEVGSGFRADIFIDTDLEPRSKGERQGGFTKFISLNGDTDYNGQPIAFWMVNWLEKGVSPQEGKKYIGNQPIEKVGMFEKVYQELNNGLSEMVNRNLISMGYIVG